MTKLTAFAVVLCGSVAATAPVLSGPLGLGAITCSELGDPDSIGYRAAVVNWVAGYASGLDAADGRFHDMQTLTSDAIFDSVVAFCSRNPSLKLSDAADSFLADLH